MLTALRLCLLTFMLLTASLSSARAQGSTAPRADVPRFDRGEASVTLPAKFTHSHILINTLINGQGPYYLALDTGASISTAPPAFLSKVLKLDAKTETNPRKWQYADVDLRFPGLSLTRLRFFTAVDYMAEDGTLICGILGYDFLGRFVLEIDYFHKTVTLHDPEKYRYSDKNDLAPQTLPFTLEGLTPHLDITLRFKGGREATVKAMVDTGAGPALVFTEEAKRRLNIGPGLDGPDIKEAQLGGSIIHVDSWDTHRPNSLSRPPFSFDVLLGNAAFENMKVVFDYANRRMITAYPFKN
ncbi:MAG: pepsin/retropepsin-like aspartic protease family protein [Pyrinomonadaceae bacterium]